MLKPNLSSSTNLALFLFVVFLYLSTSTQAQKKDGFGSAFNLSSDDKKEATLDSTTHSLSPRRAALWALIPSGGTIYNKQYIKTPIVLGSIVGLTAFTIKRRRDYNKHYQNYSNLLNDFSGLSNELATFDSTRTLKKNALRDYNFALNGIFLLYGLSIGESYISTQILNDTHEHSPVRAAYYSGLLPGLGQIYNKKIWKVPFVYAGFGAGGFAIYYYAQRTRIFTNEYLARNRPGWGEIDSRLRSFSTPSLLTARRLAQKNLQIAIMGTIGWYLVNMIDAFIDAHLIDFDVSDDLSLRLTPILVPSNHGRANLSLNWQLSF